ncbi:MAG: class I adenylate-forming enzyme family protein [Sphingobium sp.]
MLLMRDMIDRCATNFPTRTAYICGARRATWARMGDRSDRLGAALQSLGASAGTPVAILSLESIEVYEHFFACAKIGAIRIGLNPQYAWPELWHVIRDSAARILLVDARCLPLIEEHKPELAGQGITLIGYNGDHGLPLDYETLIAGAAAHAGRPPLEGDNLLLYSYTSGTTGSPKGVMLTQGSVASVIVHSVMSFGLARDDIWYMPAASAWAIVIMSLFGLGTGMTTVLPDGGFNVARFLDEVERLKVSAAILVPTMIQRVLAEQRRQPRDIASLRLLVYGSAPATPHLIRETRAELGVLMVQAYGQTESTGGWMAVLTDDDHRIGLESRPELLRSAGRIGVHYECTIRDEAGAILPPGERGEIWLRGTSLMKGYLNLPEETAEALQDGWLRSNDIGMMDADGYLYLLDRQKFMIITGAVNVFPAAVESVLADHPVIAEVAAVGVPHPEWGEAVIAVAVARQPDQQIGVPELKAFCKGRLSPPETPKHILFVDELPKTVNGKVRKADIKAWAETQAERMPWAAAG